MKTAAFTGNRRIGTASIWPQGYAGWAIFRELVQKAGRHARQQVRAGDGPGNSPAGGAGIQAAGW